MSAHQKIIRNPGDAKNDVRMAERKGISALLGRALMLRAEGAEPHDDVERAAVELLAAREAFEMANGRTPLVELGAVTWGPLDAGHLVVYRERQNAKKVRIGQPHALAGTILELALGPAHVRLSVEVFSLRHEVALRRSSGAMFVSDILAWAQEQG